MNHSTVSQFRGGFLAISLVVLASLIPISPAHAAEEGFTVSPGQNGTFAVAGAPVVLRPTTGSFPSQPSTLRLYSSFGGNGPMGLLLPVGCWNPDMIVAKVPQANPRGTSKMEGETFTIKFSSGGTTWSSQPVIITGASGSNYPDPPTH